MSVDRFVVLLEEYEEAVLGEFRLKLPWENLKFQKKNELIDFFKEVDAQNRPPETFAPEGLS